MRLTAAAFRRVGDQKLQWSCRVGPCARAQTFSTEAAMAQACEKPYRLSPLEVWGAEVSGYDLKRSVPPEVVRQIQEDVTRHRLVIFRDQGVIDAARQVEIASWFGPLESTFYKHPKSPHPDVFRVANSRSEGCMGVGRTGWHVDGSFQPRPFSHAIYHIVHAPERGTTDFMPLSKLIEGLPDDTRQRWERLWMVSNLSTGPIQPLIHSHPLTGEPALCFHTGMIQAFAWDFGTPKQRLTSRQETAALLDEVGSEFDTGRNDQLKYRHKWRPGDLILSDNLAVAHEASPETQLPPSQVGLRVMHRCTVAGQFELKKWAAA